MNQAVVPLKTVIKPKKLKIAAPLSIDTPLSIEDAMSGLTLISTEQEPVPVELATVVQEQVPVELAAKAKAKVKTEAKPKKMKLNVIDTLSIEEAMGGLTIDPVAQAVNKPIKTLSIEEAMGGLSLVETVPAIPQQSIWMSLRRAPPVKSGIVWEGIEDITDDEADDEELERRATIIKETREKIQHRYYRKTLDEFHRAGLFLSWGPINPKRYIGTRDIIKGRRSLSR
jgi:hypothetical protein